MLKKNMPKSKNVQMGSMPQMSNTEDKRGYEGMHGSLPGYKEDPGSVAARIEASAMLKGTWTEMHKNMMMPYKTPSRPSKR